MTLVGNVSRKTTKVVVGFRDSPIEVLAAAFEKPHARERAGSARVRRWGRGRDLAVRSLLAAGGAQRRVLELSEQQILQRVDEAAQNGGQEDLSSAAALRLTDERVEVVA